MKGWERPDPPRMNDTAALVRQGVRSTALKTRSYCGVEPFETPWIPENAFNKRSPRMEVAGPYGAGIAAAVRENCHTNGRGGAADRNTAVPGNGNSLAGGVAQVRKSGDC